MSWQRVAPQGGLLMTVPSTVRDRVALIPISEIHILNPRTRNKRVHRELIENIKTVGLKRPITVSRKSSLKDLSIMT